MPYINGTFQPLNDEQIIPAQQIQQECGQEPAALVGYQYHYNFFNIILLAAVVALCAIAARNYRSQITRFIRKWWLPTMIVIGSLVLVLSLFGNYQRFVSKYKLGRKFIYRTSETTLSDVGKKYLGCKNRIQNEFDINNSLK